MSEKRQGFVFYGPADRPPTALLLFSAVQHVMLVLSMGLALPVTIARCVGLDPAASGILLSMSILSIGITGILQTLPTRFLGNARLDMSVSDNAGLSASTYAAQLGGLPLVFGMTAFSGVLKAVLGSFVYRTRRLFPSEVTGTMIFILGIATIPTAVRFFLGTGAYARTGCYSPSHLCVAVSSLFVMLVCTVFTTRFKAYSVLIGIIVGYVLSAFTGHIDLAAFVRLKELSVFRPPIPSSIDIAFDLRALLPFTVVTVAAVVDNIGDYTAAQKASDLNFKRADWRCIQNGIRSSGLGSCIAGLIGGVIQSTATANIGVARATGVTSRVVGYVASGLLIVLSFFPRLAGAMMLIPEPVLGALLVFSVTYIMAGGFSTLTQVELDDRRIFTVFFSIILSVATLIPELWSFIPPRIAEIAVSPVVMGTAALLFMTTLTSLGTSRRVRLESTADPEAVQCLHERLLECCRAWGMPKGLAHAIVFGMDAVCEALAVHGVDSSFQLMLRLDRMQVRIDLVVEHPNNPEETAPGEVPDELGIAMLMLRNRFDSVSWTRCGNSLRLSIATDIV